MTPVLEVRDLKVEIPTEDGVVKAVDGLSYDLNEKQTLGIVGESGSGKSVSVMTLLGLTRSWGAIRISGRVMFEGEDLLTLRAEQLRRVRGNKIGMIFQDPLSALHPFYRVGDQLVEAVRAHGTIGRAAARARAIDMLSAVGIPEPSRTVDAYPHQISGGMRQRVMIAMAMCHEPRVLIADEPTTALDVTIQAQILALIQRLQDDVGTAVILITHDLGVVAEVTDHVVVMYAGRPVERADTGRLFQSPEHPYTWGLLRAIPRLDAPRDEEVVPIRGRPPSLVSRPTGCFFHPRCDHRRPECQSVEPLLEAAQDRADHDVACLLPASTRRELWMSLRGAKLQDMHRHALKGDATPESKVDQRDR